MVCKHSRAKMPRSISTRHATGSTRHATGDGSRRQRSACYVGLTNSSLPSLEPHQNLLPRRRLLAMRAMGTRTLSRRWSQVAAEVVVRCGRSTPFRSTGTRNRRRAATTISSPLLPTCAPSMASRPPTTTCGRRSGSSSRTGPCDGDFRQDRLSTCSARSQRIGRSRELEGKR